MPVFVADDPYHTPLQKSKDNGQDVTKYVSAKSLLDENGNVLKEFEEWKKVVLIVPESNSLGSWNTIWQFGTFWDSRISKDEKKIILADLMQKIIGWIAEIQSEGYLNKSIKEFREYAEHDNFPPKAMDKIKIPVWYLDPERKKQHMESCEKHRKQGE